MKKIGLYLFILLFPVSVSANNYEQIGDKRQSIEINNFFSDVKKENITFYEKGDFIVVTVDDFGGRFYEEYYIKRNEKLLILDKLKTISLYKEDFDVKSLECRKNIHKPIKDYDRQTVLKMHGEKCRTFYAVENTLDDLEEYVKDHSGFDIDKSRMDWYLGRYPINQKNIATYNNIAFYLNNQEHHQSAIYLLHKIIKASPDRTVAYLNIADAYWDSKDKRNAKIFYKKYLSQIKKTGEKASIPSRVSKRIAQ
jgi:hypothetical protein